MQVANSMNIEEYSETGFQYYDKSIPELLEKYLDGNNYESILDCGCGDGALLYALRTRGFLEKKSVFAVDLSRNRIDLVRRLDRDIIASVDNAERLDSIKDDSIDFLISTQVIEHVDDKEMIDSIQRVVKRGGMVYLSTVFKKWYGWFYYRNGGNWVLDPTHLREYGEECELLDLFAESEFEILESAKEMCRYAMVHFITKRLKLRDRRLYENGLMAFVQKLKLPIVGYYNWELVLRKR